MTEKIIKFKERKQQVDVYFNFIGNCQVPQKADIEKMASSKEYLDFILEQLSELEEITYRSMMGEYIVYYRGKIVGGIYDELPTPKQKKSK